ncbi:MAG: hypothetical protein HY092_03245 [Candidatus Kerfeldbacteria bacterium]|nr:hypothetical protein [Candidatus Kerfeldbacteria bacterium]
MENTATMPSASLPMPQGKPVAKKDHWLVEVVGGITLASTIVSALAMWTMVVMFTLPIGN